MNTTTQRVTPVQVMTGATAISTGNWHSLFLKTNGILWAEGYNDYGQLVEGTYTQTQAVPSRCSRWNSSAARVAAWFTRRSVPAPWAISPR